MLVDSLKLLVSNASVGIDDFNKSTVGSNGYGYLYKNFHTGKLRFITRMGSSRVCGAGAHFGDFENFMVLGGIKFDKLSDVGGLIGILSTIYS